MTDRETRIEHDLIGDKEVPGAAYFGVHTVRAVENFRTGGSPISGYPDLITAGIVPCGHSRRW